MTVLWTTVSFIVVASGVVLALFILYHWYTAAKR